MRVSSRFDIFIIFSSEVDYNCYNGTITNATGVTSYIRCK